jgi:DNA-binding transcriptional regulator YiaG
MDAQTIKEFRTRMKWSQMKLATLIGVSLPTVTKWECNKSKPSPMCLNALKRLQAEHEAVHE